MSGITSTEYETIRQRIEGAFSPFAPVSEASVFHGRAEQRRQVVEAIRGVGRHVVIYGERGVGKTSLANVLSAWLGQAIAVSHVSATRGDSFETLIRRAFASYQLTLPLPSLGFAARVRSQSHSLSDALPGLSPLVPDQVASTIRDLGYNLVLVIDEFDRLPTTEVPAFADFMKALSDDRSSSTVVLVGVAGSVNGLIGDHASISRNLMQVPMPRMSEDELLAIVDKGFTLARCRASTRVVTRIIRACHGFPHYAHLLGQYAAVAALDRCVANVAGIGGDGYLTVDESDLADGMNRAVQTADQTHRESYHNAVHGDRDSLWVPVVTACALASADDRGYFNSRAVLETLNRLLPQTKVVQQTFSYHLGELITDRRGPLLERTGVEKRYLYRFVDPLMRPYILMRAEADASRASTDANPLA